MKDHRNPLTASKSEPHADLTTLETPTVFLDRRPIAKREIRDARRTKTAAEALDGFDHQTTVHALTKGQFSLLDVLTAITEITGPCALDISTWTAAKTDVGVVCDWLQAERITASRWLVDLTFQRRTPSVAMQIRNLFGPDAIRVAQNHAKLALLRNDEWSVVIQTSMNLNFNPRFENFTASDDPELCQFYQGIFDEVWKRQSRKLAYGRPREISKHFTADI
jgi:hypothetical protein